MKTPARENLALRILEGALRGSFEDGLSVCPVALSFPSIAKKDAPCNFAGSNMKYSLLPTAR